MASRPNFVTVTSSSEGGGGDLGTPPPTIAPVRKVIPQTHTPARSSQCWSRQTPAWTRRVHLDAPGQRHGATAPFPGRPTPGVVKQDKSSGGSVDTTKTRSGPRRVRMSSGERPIGAAKGKQSDTEALCQPPPHYIPPCGTPNGRSCMTVVLRRCDSSRRGAWGHGGRCGTLNGHLGCGVASSLACGDGADMPRTRITVVTTKTHPRRSATARPRRTSAQQKDFRKGTPGARY